MRRRLWAIAMAGGGLVGACVDLQPYACQGDAECTSASEGVCEDTGRCSYPDDGCESGRRYGDLGAELAGECTRAAGTTGPGDTGPDLTSTSEGETTRADTSTGTSGSDGTSEDTTLPPLPVCGDGVAQGDEECDHLDEVDGDGCNTDCVRSGSPRWSRIVTGKSTHDVLFGLTQIGAGDAVVAVGYTQIGEQEDNRDILLVRYDVDAGDEVARVVYDVAGGRDDAVAVRQGGPGPLYVCGSATTSGDVTRPWVWRWDAQLADPPSIDEEIPGFAGACHDIAYVSSSRTVAVGGNTSTAWVHAFADDDVAGGEQASLALGSPSNFKEVVSFGPEVYVAGQVAGLGSVYQLEFPLAIGDPLWQTMNPVEVQTMDIDPDTIVIGGFLDDQPRTYDNLWAGAYGLDGMPRWTFFTNYMGYDEIEDLAIDGAGNVYVIGHVVGSLADRWVAKLDSEGGLVWSRNDYPGSEDGQDRGRSIEVLPGGDLIVVAEVIGEDGLRDGWIARLAP